jgi:hypothetical protein
MEVPDFCSDWLSNMEQAEPQRKILAHLAAEQCVAPEISKRFWEALNRRWANLPANERAASTCVDAACAAARDAGAFFAGPAIIHERFEHLFRVFPFHMLKHVNKTIFDNIELKEYGLNENEILNNKGTIPKEYFEPLISYFDREYGGKFSDAVLANRNGIVFVCPGQSDGLASIPRDFSGDIANKLALGFKKGDFCFLVYYSRSSVAGDLHRPTSIDAIDKELFWPVGADCTAPFGLTAPNGDQSVGEPEAVHRRVDLTNLSFMLFIVP